MPRKKPAHLTNEQWTAYKLRVRRRATAALPQEMEVQVGAMTAKVEAGPDKKLGTADDKITITPGDTVKTLKAKAKKMGVKLPAKVKKADIIKALKAASK